jgi:hypothetical protein
VIRWYDYPIAFLAADVMATAFFTLPIFIGAFVAWGVYGLWMNVYCLWRKNNENGE